MQCPHSVYIPRYNADREREMGLTRDSNKTLLKYKAHKPDRIRTCRRQQLSTSIKIHASDIVVEDLADSKRVDDLGRQGKRHRITAKNRGGRNGLTPTTSTFRVELQRENLKIDSLSLVPDPDICKRNPAIPRRGNGQSPQIQIVKPSHAVLGLSFSSASQGRGSGSLLSLRECVSKHAPVWSILLSRGAGGGDRRGNPIVPCVQRVDIPLHTISNALCNQRILGAYQLLNHVTLMALSKTVSSCHTPTRHIPSGTAILASSRARTAGLQNSVQGVHHGRLFRQLVARRGAFISNVDQAKQ